MSACEEAAGLAISLVSFGFRWERLLAEGLNHALNFLLCSAVRERSDATGDQLDCGRGWNTEKFDLLAGARPFECERVHPINADLVNLQTCFYDIFLS
jgi:hypothetical protein